MNPSSTATKDSLRTNQRIDLHFLNTQSQISQDSHFQIVFVSKSADDNMVFVCFADTGM